MNDCGIICATIAAHDYNLMSASIAAFESSQGYSRFTPDDIIEIMRTSEFAEQGCFPIRGMKLWKHSSDEREIFCCFPVRGMFPYHIKANGNELASSMDSFFFVPMKFCFDQIMHAYVNMRI